MPTNHFVGKWKMGNLFKLNVEHFHRMTVVHFAFEEL